MRENHNWNEPVEGIWVKKKINARDWNSHHSTIPGYCFLGEEGGKVVIGFLAVKSVPYDCEKQTTMDLVQTQKYCENEKIYPLPYKANTL